jgi:SAM-dependent methyltransferase
MAEPPHPDTAIRLRQTRDFPPVRISVFEDPADRKSALGTQRYAGLSNFYADREPQWYASTTEELAGLGRVLDLGCGPGLALAALRAHGVPETIGVDRWEGFRPGVEAAGGRLIVHDLTLPMPFLRSASFDGIFSHFALEYISPISVLQVLREARRLLRPDGLMLLHLTTAGLAMGDQARTTPYDTAALTRLLRSAGFESFDVEQPDDKQVAIVRARGTGSDSASTDTPSGEPTVLESEAGGEIQLAAGFLPAPATDTNIAIEVEVSEGAHAIEYRPHLSLDTASDEGEALVDTAVCVRLVAVTADRFELQAWAWRGSQVAAIDTIGLATRPELIRVRIEGALQHHNAWRPEPPMLELPGDAYTTIDQAYAPHEAGEEWIARGRQVLVERPGDDPGALRDAAESKDHFVVHRPDPAAADFAALEREWKEGRLHGLVLALEDATRDKSLPLLLWAGFRGALVYLEPESWAEIESAAQQIPRSLGSPLIVVDPSLAHPEGEAEAEVEVPKEILASAIEKLPALYVVLSAEAAEAATALCARHPTRVLIAGKNDPGELPVDGRLIEESAENLRYLTERTTLIRLR